ncbi:MAG TPA: gamma-glutamyltransferase [Rhodothermales bacterium]|nr:gamma-glutamyltransferase [Rhodothermales bacterium]
MKAVVLRTGTVSCLVAAAVLLAAQAVWPWRTAMLAPTPQADYGDPVRAEHGMVVSASRLASQAGVDVLKKGGNAIDAAVATGFALAVTFPAAGNLGGGGFMAIRFPEGKATTIDFREKAPLDATRNMFLDSTGTFVPERSQRGYLASGVPGSPAGLLLAHEQYGKLPLKDVLAPAIRLAERGFPLSRSQAHRFNAFRGEFSQFPGTKKYFTKADGTPYREGERFVQRDLAAVLKRIRKHGWAGFYEGKTADLIAREMARGHGLMTKQDLASYQAVERPPVRGTYRGYRIISMGPPSSGGIALVQLLNAVEPFDVHEMGFNSSETIHLMGEAMRRVYADRAYWLGDPDYVRVPIQHLIDKDYMRRRMADFNPYRADTSRALTHGNPLAYESTETTHFSVVDNDGIAVAVTTTINGYYGSKVVVDGAGFFLNNEMDDFSAKPGTPNMFGLVGAEANAIQPGKRMLSSMSPTIVEDPEGDLFMVIGTPGGATIITTVFQVVMNVIDHGMNIQAAVSAPRVHHQWLPDVLRYERMGLAKDVVRNLEQRGWKIEEDNGTWGAADGIVVRAGGSEASRILFGGADPRGENAAVGY